MDAEKLRVPHRAERQGRMIAAALILISAIAYRVRGSSYLSDLPSGFLFGVARGDRLFKILIGAFPVALGAYLSGAPLSWSLGVWAAVSLCDTLPHASFQGIANLWQCLGMSCLGLLSSGPVAAALWFSGGHVVALSSLAIGCLAGPAYWVGNKTPWVFGINKLWPTLFDGPTLGGELTYGATRAMFLLVGGFQ